MLKLPVLLALASIAIAHDGGGDDHVSDPAPSHSDQPPSTVSASPAPEWPPTYFAHPEHTSMIYAHIGIMVLAWVFLLPVAVMFSIARSRYTGLLRAAFLAVNALGLVLGVGYNHATPNLYPGNIHGRVAWIITILACAQVGLALLRRAAAAAVAWSRSTPTHEEGQSFLRAKEEPEYRPGGRWDYHTVSRASHDSGQGTEPNSASRSSAGSPVYQELPLGDRHGGRLGQDDSEPADYPLPGRGGKKGELIRAIATKIPQGVWKCLDFGSRALDRIIIPLGFFAITTGIAVFCRFLEGRYIYSGLAHFIKGGVFFWFGILVLGRWSGCFGDLGWAWNIRPKSQSRWCSSAEFVESGTIFLYGSTNIFMERLGANSPITPKDLEHISIAALFIGGGLLGMLIESTRARYFLNATTEEAAVPSGRLQQAEEESQPQLQPPATYGFSLNPIPALVILLVGMLISGHQQADMFELMIHSQWGNLLFAASIARMGTYVLLYLKPPQSVLPSRPPTELLAAFGLMAGGLVFMQSTKSVVVGMKQYHLEVMFVYAATLGVVGVLMAWVILVLVLKGWAVRRERRPVQQPRL